MTTHSTNVYDQWCLAQSPLLVDEFCQCTEFTCVQLADVAGRFHRAPVQAMPFLGLFYNGGKCEHCDDEMRLANKFVSTRLLSNAARDQWGLC